MLDTKHPSLRYMPEIDGLRAIAVLSVLFYHAHLGVNAGLTGVDVFFVISGYLITSLLRQEWNETGRIDFFAFYARRVRRLLPALVSVVLVVFVAAIVVYAPRGELKAVSESAAASLLFAGNLYFQRHTGGYFDPQAESFPLMHLWSLGVEEQFYLVWPIGLILLLRYGRTSSTYAIVALALASLALAEYWLFVDVDAAFYQMPARFWELAVGGAIAFAPQGGLADGRVPAAVGVLAILLAASIPISHFPGVGALPAVGGAACLIYAVHRSSRLGWVGTWLRSRPMVFVGLISYSLYLWHWPLFAMVNATHIGSETWGWRILLCLVSLVLASLSYRFVERPVRRSTAAAVPRRVVIAGVTMSLALAFCAINIADALNGAPQPNDLASRTERDMPGNRIECHYRGDQALDVFPRPGCVSAKNRPLRTAIWGDSRALAWQPFAWTLAEQAGVSTTNYSRDACPPVADYDNGKPAREAALCREFNARVMKQIVGLDVLVLAAAWPEDVGKREFSVKFEETLRKVAPQVRRVIVLGPTPVLRDAAPKCIRLNALADCDLARGDFDIAAHQSREFLSSLSTSFANVEYVDLSDFFCNEKSCPVLKGDYALYWDSNHISSTAAREFALEFLSREKSRSTD